MLIKVNTMISRVLSRTHSVTVNIFRICAQIDKQASQSLSVLHSLIAGRFSIQKKMKSRLSIEYHVNVEHLHLMNQEYYKIGNSRNMLQIFKYANLFNPHFSRIQYLNLKYQLLCDISSPSSSQSSNPVNESGNMVISLLIKL